MNTEQKKTYLKDQFNGPTKTMRDFGINNGNEFLDVSGVDGITIRNICRDTDLDAEKVMEGIRDIGQVVLPTQSAPGAVGLKTQFFDREAVRAGFENAVGSF